MFTFGSVMLTSRSQDSQPLFCSSRQPVVSNIFKSGLPLAEGGLSMALLWLLPDSESLVKLFGTGCSVQCRKYIFAFGCEGRYLWGSSFGYMWKGRKYISTGAGWAEIGLFVLSKREGLRHLLVHLLLVVSSLRYALLSGPPCLSPMRCEKKVDAVLSPKWGRWGQIDYMSSLLLAWHSNLGLWIWSHSHKSLPLWARRPDVWKTMQSIFNWRWGQVQMLYSCVNAAPDIVWKWLPEIPPRLEKVRATRREALFVLFFFFPLQRVQPIFDVPGTLLIPWEGLHSNHPLRSQSLPFPPTCQYPYHFPLFATCIEQGHLL